MADDDPIDLTKYRRDREMGPRRPYLGPAVEVGEVEVRPAREGSGVEAEVRGNVLINGDGGYWISVVGWGGTEAEARASLKVAINNLGADVQFFAGVSTVPPAGDEDPAS